MTRNLWFYRHPRSMRARMGSGIPGGHRTNFSSGRRRMGSGRGQCLLVRSLLVTVVVIAGTAGQEGKAQEKQDFERWIFNHVSTVNVPSMLKHRGDDAFELRRLPIGNRPNSEAKPVRDFHLRTKCLFTHAQCSLATAKHRR